VIVSKSSDRISPILAEMMFAIGILSSTACAQSVDPTPPPQAVASPALHRISRHSSSPYRAMSLTPHAKDRYELQWGIDSVDVKAVESGQMIRFSYLVLDPALAAQLNDKKEKPFLVDEKAGVKLEVPIMEKVGQLRQTATPESGRSYWMVFSNKERLVKPGDRVRVMIGKFHADGLFVH